MKKHAILGERLRALRMKQGLSQADLGKRTGLLHALISHIEKGQIVPDLELLERITTALSVPLYTLFVTDERFMLLVTKRVAPAKISLAAKNPNS